MKQRIRVVSAAVMREGRYLITQRSEKSVLPLLWEFPGGRVEGHEGDGPALVRELQHRLGVAATVGEHLSATEREYDKYIVELHLYRCELAGTPQARNVKDLRWVASSELTDYEFTPADEASMDALLGLKKAG